MSEVIMESGLSRAEALRWMSDLAEYIVKYAASGAPDASTCDLNVAVDALFNIAGEIGIPSPSLLEETDEMAATEA